MQKNESEIGKTGYCAVQKIAGNDTVKIFTCATLC